MSGQIFDIDCRACPRLAGFLDEVAEEHPGYHCRPVPPFGAAEPRLLIVGLAPGLHGANRTGRPFTGDYAGILLYQTLHRFGFAHGALHDLDRLLLLDSYHCSRYNTNTGRLTEAMFDAVFGQARALLGEAEP